MKQSLLLCILFFSFLFSQASIVTGTVTDTKDNVLGFASIIVKGTTKGAVANSRGKYSLNLEPGTYTLVCQYVGFRSEEKTITVGTDDMVVDFRLPEQDLKMEEVVIKRGEDPALEIMRQTIKKREYYNKQVDSLTVDVYIKGLVRSREMPKRMLGQRIDTSEFGKMGLDSAGKGILFLSESVTKVSYKRPDKIKFEVVSSRQSGGGFGFDFPFFVNFYTNNVALFSGNVNPRGFVSPVADAAFHYYKFKFEGSFFDGNKMIDRIRVTPKRKHEPLFEGFIQIVDGEWRIHSLNLSTRKDQGLDLLDTIRVTQIHSEVGKDIYRTSNQVVSFTAKMLGFGFTGDFLNVYTNYNFDPGFQKKFFNRVIMKYDTASNKRDSVYWSTIRPVPLEADEKRDFILKDSIRRSERDSMSRHTRDSLRRMARGQGLGQTFMRGYTRDYYHKFSRHTFRLESLVGGIEYNTVEGLSLSLRPSYTINRWRKKNDLVIAANVRYGTSNKHLLGFGTVTVKPREENFRNRYWQFSGGKRLLQFNRDNPIHPLVNTIHTLFYKENFLKVYEAWFGKATYNNRFENGLRLNVSVNYGDRIPVTNRTDFAFFKKDNIILPNHPYELAAISFERHAALVTSVSISYQPGQYYIEFPRHKMPIGSKYPTFELKYDKGIPTVFNSVADFDKWQFSIYDDANLKLAGLFKYRISAGGFFNRDRVDIPDFTHFNGNQLSFAAPYMNSFQLASYYRYSNTERLYGLLHAEHHFNGLLTNKIPFLNQLKWNLVAGTNTFYVNRSNYYVEAFAGLENILKIFRVDFVTANQAQGGTSFGVRVGLGGVIGGAVKLDQ